MTVKTVKPSVDKSGVNYAFIKLSHFITGKTTFLVQA